MAGTTTATPMLHSCRVFILIIASTTPLFHHHNPIRMQEQKLYSCPREECLSDVQRFVTQLASSVASEESGPFLFVLVGGTKISGKLIGRKGYIERMRAIAALVSESERAMFEMAFTQLETAPDLLDTLYLENASVNDNPCGRG